VDAQVSGKEKETLFIPLWTTQAGFVNLMSCDSLSLRPPVQITQLGFIQGTTANARAPNRGTSLFCFRVFAAAACLGPAVH